MLCFVTRFVTVVDVNESIINRSVVIEAGPYAGRCGIVTWESATGRSLDVMLTDCYDGRAPKVAVRRSSVEVVLVTTTCARCGEPIVRAATGRPPIYCSGRCRVAALRSRERASVGSSGSRTTRTRT